MDFNRNHYFLIGVVLVLLGVQFRLVDSYVLNEGASKFMQQRSAQGSPMQGANRMFAAVGPTPRKIIRPPEWLGWAMMSVGSVLVLHSLAMKAPGA